MHMGNQNQRANRHNKNNQQNLNMNVMKCPKCQIVFPQQVNIQDVFIQRVQFANHIRNCFQGIEQPQVQPVEPPKQESAFEYEKVLC